MTKLKCRMAALAVAMAAKTGAVEALDVDTLEEMAAQLLHWDDPLRRAITEFAVQYELSIWDRTLLIAAGEALFRAVEQAAAPGVPIDADRVDIHG